MQINATHAFHLNVTAVKLLYCKQTESRSKVGQDLHFNFSSESNPSFNLYPKRSQRNNEISAERPNATQLNGV